MVMLVIMAAHDGRLNPKMSGGGKKSHKYPPTMMPMGKAPVTQANNWRFLSRSIIAAAMKFAAGPKKTSVGPSQ